MTAVELELVDGRQRVRKRGNLYNLFLKLHYFHENTANRIYFKSKHWKYVCSKIIFVSKILQNVRRKLHLMLSLMQSLNCTCRFLGFLKGTSKYFYVIKHLFLKIHYFHENTANRIPCGPSIMDYPETSGNLRKPAAD